jgi:cytochrome b6-f complex iron-sulfur subunit
MESGRQKSNRRTFLRIASTGILSVFGILWYKMALVQNQKARGMKKVFPFHKNKPVAFIENYIIVNHEKETVVFSAHCSHLGCLINKTENGKLVCPCHGSEYGPDGRPVKGPAYKNLEIIPAKISSDGTQIELEG